MKTHYIDIDGAWGVIFVYGFKKRDAWRLSDIMESFGLDDIEIKKALSVLYQKNTGMTISRSDLEMSAIFVGETTSVEQFFDTIAHEVDHVQSAICETYGVPYGSEDAAWAQGYLMRTIVRKVKNDLIYA